MVKDPRSGAILFYKSKRCKSLKFQVKILRLEARPIKQNVIQTLLWDPSV
jgi:hypothetical protein